MPNFGRPDPYGIEGGATPPPDDSRYTVTLRGDAHVVRMACTELVDQVDIDEIGNGIRARLHADGARLVILDLDAVDHLSSACLGMLLQLKSTLESQGGQFCMAAVKPDLRQVFSITRLDEAIPIHDTTLDALKALTGD